MPDDPDLTVAAIRLMIDEEILEDTPDGKLILKQ
jgi:hypothetical protein